MFRRRGLSVRTRFFVPAGVQYVNLPTMSFMVCNIFGGKYGNRTMFPAERLLIPFRRPNLWDEAKQFLVCIAVIDTYVAGTRDDEVEVYYIR